MKVTLRALRYRNYRLFFGGQAISLVGTWMQNIALSWLIYRLTNSALALGAIGFVSQVPQLFIAPFAGVLADRFNRRNMLVATQTLLMLQAITLSVLVLSHHIAVWHVFALAIFSGLVFAFDMPTRQAFVVEMVEDRQDLGNAIALNSAMFNSARIVGPSIGGVVIAILGEGLCFLANGISFIAVIIALLLMKVRKRAHEQLHSGPMWAGVKEGARYAFGSVPIRYILMLLALVNLMGMPYNALMPIFAKNVLHGTASTMGFLLGANGLGALAGALFLASRQNVRGLMRVIPLATGIFGGALLMFAVSRTMWLSLVLMVFVGLGAVLQMACCNTVIQSVVDDEKRGRVMGFYMMAFAGTTPFGTLLAGAMSAHIGAPTTVYLGATGCLIGAMVFAWYLPLLRRDLRAIYSEKGIV